MIRRPPGSPLFPSTTLSRSPPGRRRAALGIQAGAQALGLALGPVAGGLLVASAGWRSIFFINVPVGVVAVAAGWVLLPRTRPDRKSTSPDSSHRQISECRLC